MTLQTQPRLNSLDDVLRKEYPDGGVLEVKLIEGGKVIHILQDKGVITIERARDSMLFAGLFLDLLEHVAHNISNVSTVVRTAPDVTMKLIQSPEYNRVMNDPKYGFIAMIVSPNDPMAKFATVTGVGAFKPSEAYLAEGGYKREPYITTVADNAFTVVRAIIRDEQGKTTEPKASPAEQPEPPKA